MNINKICNVLAYLVKEDILFIIGGYVYVLIECLWRGYSHPTMFIVGGLCFVLIGILNEIFTESMSLLTQGIIGSAIVTTIELISGYIINIQLGLDVWDYSDLPLNILGQVCLPYSFLWIVLSIIAVVVDDFCRECIFGEPRVQYHLFPKRTKK